MKFLPSFKSAKSLALAAVTIATSIAGSVAPSQASRATRVISTPGQQLQIVIFDGDKQAFKIGCPGLRKVWSKLPTQAVSAQEFQNTLNGTLTKLPTRELPCNSPSRVKGYVTPDVGSGFGIIMTDGIAFGVKGDEFFFRAMNITPIQLTAKQLRDFSNQHPELQQNTVLEPLIASGFAIPPTSTPIPPPPTQPPASSISLLNLGAYIIRYKVTYNMVDGTNKNFDSGNITVGKKVVLTIPPKSTNIKVTAKVLGLPALSRDLGNSHSNHCFTSSGTLLNPKMENNICN
jgi:hypothetical protein